MQDKIEKLTAEMLAPCGGHKVAVAVASAFNVAQTLRYQADVIDQMISGSKH